MIHFLISFLLISPLYLISAEEPSQAITWQSIPDDVKSQIARLLPNPNDLARKEISFKEKLKTITYVVRIKMTCKAAGTLDLPYHSHDKIGNFIQDSKIHQIIFASLVNDNDSVKEILEESASLASAVPWYKKLIGQKDLRPIAYIYPLCQTLSYLTEGDFYKFFNEKIRISLYHRMIGITRETYKKNNQSYQDLISHFQQDLPFPSNIQILYKQDPEKIIEILAQLSLCGQKPYDTILGKEQSGTLWDYNCTLFRLKRRKNAAAFA